MPEQIEIFENNNIEEVNKMKEVREVVEIQDEVKTEAISTVSETQISNKTIWNDAEIFASSLKMADALSKSSMIPQQYQNKPGNCLIALDFANRMNMTPLMIMQSLYIVNGNPSWSGQACVALINNCGRFEPLSFEESVSEDKSKYSCRAYAIEKATGKTLYSTVVDDELVKSAGWAKKSGSYWLVMPEQMARYRAAAFFARAYCPEALMGLYTVDEQRDIHGYEDKPESKTYRR